MGPQTQNPAVISLFVYDEVSVSESCIGMTGQMLTAPDDALRYLARILVSESLQRHKQRYANTA